MPNGTQIDNDNSNIHFRRSGGPSVSRLKLQTINGTAAPSGVFRCEIPDASGTGQSIYVGIYPPGMGAPTINKFPEYTYSENQILTCTSIGGPATTTEWMKDDQILGVAEYEQQKRIINQTTGEYQSILSLGQLRPDEAIGNYTCRVSNSRNGDTKTIRLYGKYHSFALLPVALNLFGIWVYIVGIQTTEIESNIPLDKNLSLNCTTDLAFTIMTWLDSDGKVIANTSEQRLTLVINKIIRAHHNAQYTCQVVGPFGNQNKSVTLLVAQQSLTRSATIGGAVVAVLFILLLLVAGIVFVIIFTAKR